MILQSRQTLDLGEASGGGMRLLDREQLNIELAFSRTGCPNTVLPEVLENTS